MGRLPGFRLGGTALIALGVTLIVVVAATIVLLGGNRAVASYAPDSPEGAFQQYLTAWYGEDYDSAYGFFSSSVKGRVSLDSFTMQSQYGATNQTVSLVQTTGSGDRITVVVRVEDHYGGDQSYEHQETITMLREADGWRIDEALLGVDQYYSY